MHRESIFVCTYAQGADRVMSGRVRAWDVREAAQLFAFELETEDLVTGVGPSEVEVHESPRTVTRRRRRSTPKR